MWEWLMDQSRYETWPHIVAIFVGIFIGNTILYWTDEWKRFPRIRRVLLKVFWVYAAVMAVAIVGTFVFESGIVD